MIEEQKWHNKNVEDAFKNAINGCHYAFTTQRNFKIHFLIALLVVGLSVWLQIPLERFLILILAIIVGLTVEMVNTVAEKTVDLITEKYNEKAKLIKDVAAGMMLLTALGLAILGLLVLLPALWQKLNG